MSDSSFSGVSGVLGIGSRQATNPILQLRKLQEQIKTAPALSRNDLATRTRLSAERSGIQARSSLFSTLRSELGKLNTAARDAVELRSSAKKTEINGTPASFTTNNGLLGLSATGAFSSGSFSLSVSQLASASSSKGAAISAQKTIQGTNTQSTASAIASQKQIDGTKTVATGDKISETRTTDEVLSDDLEVKKSKVEGGKSLIELKKSADGDDDDGDGDDDDGDSGDSVELSTGDQVRVQGTLSSGSDVVVSDGETLFVRAEGGDGKKFALFRTQEDAENNTNRIEFDKNQKSLTNIQKVEVAASSVDVNIGTSTKLSESNLAGFSGGSGSFQVNGKTIDFDGSDTFGDLVSSINSSGAGVTAALDQDSRELTLTNNAAGATNISVTSGSTGLAASLGLTSLTETLGTDDQTLDVDISESTKLNQSNLDGFSKGSGSFEINGKTVSFNGSDTIGDLLSSINNSGAGVTAALDQNTRQITLTNDETGASDITVTEGSTGLAASLGLTNRATTLGTDDQTLDVDISESTKLNQSNLDGFSKGSGSFEINGKTVSFNGSDTIGDLLSSINNSGAGVTAALDQNTRQITLTNDETGASDITVTEGSTGLAASLGLTNRATTLGNDTQVTANGKTFSSNSNTISGSTFGVSGVQVDISNLSAGDSATVTLNAVVKGETIVDVEVEDVGAAVSAFFDQFNKVQAFLETNAEAGGRVFDEISRGLRGAVSQIYGNSALSGGISGSGTSNQVTIDVSALDKGIQSGNQSVLSLFGGGGFAAKTAKFVSGVVGSNGTLSREVSRDEKAEARVSNRLDDLSEKEESNRLRLNESLSAVAQSLIAIQGQKSFLQGIGSETDASRASRTREGSTGLNLSGQLELIQNRARNAGINTNQGVDPTDGIAGIEKFLNSILG